MTQKVSDGRAQWEAAYQEANGLKDLLEKLRNLVFPRHKMQTPKMKHRVGREEGPMKFLADQIVKRMERSGYPAKVYTLYRTPEQQQKEFEEGDSKANAWSSPHQFYEGVDIVHPTEFWKAPKDYWDHLATVSRVVAKEYNVDLVLGYDWGWDSAHIELESWRTVRQRQIRQNGKNYPPTKLELWERFKEILPSEAPPRPHEEAQRMPPEEPELRTLEERTVPIPEDAPWWVAMKVLAKEKHRQKEEKKRLDNKRK